MSETIEERNARIATRHELDILIAEKVLGWRPLSGDQIPDSMTSRSAINGHRRRIWIDTDGIRQACEECGDMPEFSEGFACWTQVVPRLIELGWWPTVNYAERGAVGHSHWDDVWHCSFGYQKDGQPTDDDDNDTRRYVHGFGPTPQQAILRAALEAVGAADVQ